jgi:ribosome-associated translation inhibitor RaiA
LSTDKTIHGNESLHDHFTSLIATKLAQYKTHIFNIDAHVKDENGIKEGRNDISCLLEASLEGRKTMIASNQADTIELAVSGAIEKLKHALDTNIGRIENHSKN